MRMTTESFIDNSIPTLRLGQEPVQALSVMREQNSRSLAVLDNESEAFMGVITEKDLLECLANGEHINAQWGMAQVAANKKMHLFDAIRLAHEHKFSLLPVIDDANLYLGTVKISDLLDALSESMHLFQEGSVITITMPTNDIILSDIVHACEKENVKVLGTSITPGEDEETSILSIKTNALNTKHIAASLKGLGYIVSFTSDGAFETDMQQRADELMHYLSM